MRKFEHITAKSLDEAVATLQEYKGDAMVIAGGTDLLGCLRDDIWLTQPKAIINLKTVPGLNEITEEDGFLNIGALTTLTRVAESEMVKAKFPALAQAAKKTASPLLRNLGTLAGNICQENRCWYYRYSHQIGGRVDCVRKGGKKCLAVTGDNRYHSIFGAQKKCIAVNPSDTAPALMVLNAKIKTSRRTIPIEEFFTSSRGKQSTILDTDEIVTQIQIPVPDKAATSVFNKFALRKTIDFPIVNCAVCLTAQDNRITKASIAMNAVYCDPVVASEAQEFLLGKQLTETVAAEAAETAVAKARPLIMNKYKVQIAKTLIKDSVLACMELYSA